MKSLTSEMIALAFLALTVFVVFYVATRGIQRAKGA